MTSQIIKSSREANIELLRIISIILILMMHIVSFITERNYNSINFLFIEIINSIANIGVSIFILITGYFGLKHNLSKIIHLIYLTTLYSLISYGLGLVISGNAFTLSKLIKSLFTIPTYANWYISCYIVFSFISSYINRFLDTLSKKDFEKVLIILFTLFCVIPTIFNSAHSSVIYLGGKSLQYFTFLYMVGRYIRAYKTIEIKFRTLFYILILNIFIVNVFNLSLTYVFKKNVLIFSQDCSPFILFAALSVFFIFNKISIKNRLINYFSSSVISVYLLDSLRIPINYLLFSIEAINDFYTLVGYVILCTLVTFFVAIFIDKIRIVIFETIESKLNSRITQLVNRTIAILDAKLNQY